MATTSLWRVNGWLGKVVIYVENPEKTENPAFYEERDRNSTQSQGLSDVIGYAINSRKTQKLDDENTELVQSFVSGINCYPGTAREEMLAVKRRFGKEDGTVAYHGYQSFAPGEATPEIAHEIGVKLAQRLWGERYQVLVATHLDKATHLHNHFVVNTVSFVDGIKFHRTAKDYHDMRAVSDALCREYGLSVIEKPQYGRTKSYAQWNADKTGQPGWHCLIRTDIDKAIRQSMTMQQFWNHLRKQGYEIKMEKYISLRPPGKERFVRMGGKLGEDYTVEAVRRRILTQTRVERPMPEPKRQFLRRRVRGDLRSQKKATGFRALYYHYCYLLGYFPKKRQHSNKRLHFLLREDLLKMEAISEEARLLARHHMDTAEQLSSYKSALGVKIEALTADRNQLYRKRRTVAVKMDEAKLEEVKAEITALSKTLSSLKKEVRLCDDIAVRSGVMSGKIQFIQRDEQSRAKEMKHNEQFRRRSRTGR